MMTLKHLYAERPIHFLGLEKCGDWTLKCYGIAVTSGAVGEHQLRAVRKYLPEWLKNAKLTDLPTYNVATHILHEGKEGCFAIISWWLDENMLQLFAYLSTHAKPGIFELISDKGIVSCVWEMEVLWFERNAWVEEVMKRKNDPRAFDNYLNKHLNTAI